MSSTSPNKDATAATAAIASQPSTPAKPFTPAEPTNTGRCGHRGGMPTYQSSILSCDFSSPDPFQFLDLPHEIQDKIYECVYDPYDLSVRMSVPPYNGTERKPNWCEYQENQFVVEGNSYPHGGAALACVSKKVRQDSRKARQDAFNGKLGMGWDEDDQGFEDLPADKWALLRSRVTELSIGSTSRSCTDLRSTFWKNMPTLFPQVKKFQINHEFPSYQHIGRGSTTETSAWKLTEQDGYMNDFRDGRYDVRFAGAARTMKLYDLARVMEVAGREYKILLHSATTWMNNGLDQHAVFWQSINFRVYSGHLEGLERK